MSQGFKLKFDEMQENNPAKPEGEDQQTIKNTYAEPGHVRNLCFVWEDGTMVFLNYAYLVSCKYDPGANTIALYFTTDTVVLEGINLQRLYFDVMSQVPKIITCRDPRYNALEEQSIPVVNRIELIPKE